MEILVSKGGGHVKKAMDHWGDCPLYETVYSEKHGFAILRNMQSIQAEEICRTREELKAVRENDEKRMKEGK
jgi:hypothetical protein